MNQDSESVDLLSLLLVIIIIVSSGVAYFFQQKYAPSSGIRVPKVCHPLRHQERCIIIGPRFRR